MSGEINRVPTGLLNLLDLAARGQNPRSLAAELSATVEISQLYLQQLRRAATGSSSAANLEGTWSVNITVPQSQLWWVHNYSVTISSNLNAGTTYRTCLAIRQFPAITTAFEQLSVVDVTTFNAGERISKGTREPFIALPGAVFLVHVNEVTLGTAVIFDAIVDYTPLAI